MAKQKSWALGSRLDEAFVSDEERVIAVGEYRRPDVDVVVGLLFVSMSWWVGDECPDDVEQ